MCFINVYTYPNPKPTLYNNAKIVIVVVQCEKNYAILMCACPVDEAVHHLALTILQTLISMFRCVWLGLDLNRRKVDFVGQI